MFKKAQAAMEFLMTYGWAILVVLVVIGALAYFGVLNPSSLVPERCALTLPFDCRGANAVIDAAGDDAITLAVNNVGTRDITVYDVTFSSTALTADCTYYGPVGVAANTVTPVSLNTIGNLSSNCEFAANTAGDKTKLSASIRYVYDDAATITNQMVGEVVTTVQG
ncbi:hypothetical protein HYX10_02795 [Candidatus Woesearchaeota archaeon]|nr:hypothetical protein [Candidatus Woesearchaeota archaeon]